MAKTFRVGQRVKVIRFAKDWSDWADAMENSIGRTFTVTRVGDDSEGHLSYTLDNNFYWPPWALEHVSPIKINGRPRYINI